MGLDRLSFGFELKEAGEDDNFFFIEGYASTFGNIDHHDDVIMAGAFVESISAFNTGKLHLSLLWQHDTDVPLGVITELREDSKGLFFKAKLPKDDVFVSGRVMPQVRAGSVATLSIGFRVRDRSFEDELRIITKIDLWEISLATIPANNQAVITGHKGLFKDLPVTTRDYVWDEKAATTRVGDRKEAFVTVGGEKHLFTDVVGEELHVVPQALFKVAAGVGGDDPEAKDHLVNYYKKLGLESPFGKSFRIDDWGAFSTLEKRCQERLLREGIRFSGTSAKRLVSIMGEESESKGQWDPKILEDLKSMAGE